MLRLRRWGVFHTAINATATTAAVGADPAADPAANPATGNPATHRQAHRASHPPADSAPGSTAHHVRSPSDRDAVANAGAVAGPNFAADLITIAPYNCSAQSGADISADDDAADRGASHSRAVGGANTSTNQLAVSSARHNRAVSGAHHNRTVSGANHDKADSYAHPRAHHLGAEQPAIGGAHHNRAVSGANPSAVSGAHHNSAICGAHHNSAEPRAYPRAYHIGADHRPDAAANLGCAHLDADTATDNGADRTAHGRALTSALVRLLWADVLQVRRVRAPGAEQPSSVWRHGARRRGPSRC